MPQRKNPERAARPRERMLVTLGVAGVVIAGSGGGIAWADNVGYAYDLRGRLIQVTYLQGGDTNTGGDVYTSSYNYDNSDNRKTVTVAGSAFPNQPYSVDPGNGSESLTQGADDDAVLDLSGNTGD